MKSATSHFSSAHSQQNQSTYGKGIQQPGFFSQVGDPEIKRSFKGHKDAITNIVMNPNLK